MGAMVQASQLGGAKIAHFGSERQKRTWLPSIASGDCLPTYVLNGRKVFVGNSHVVDLHGVVVRTGPGLRGMSAFLESDRPGFSLAPQQPAMGLRGFSFGELVMEDVRVPAENRLGEEGDGVAVAYSSSVCTAVRT